MAQLTQTNNVSANEQFQELKRIAKKQSQMAYVGKYATDKIFYGENNVRIGLKPKIIHTIGTNSRLLRPVQYRPSIEYYFLTQQDLFGVFDVADIVSFRDSKKRYIQMPGYITREIKNARYHHEGYWKVALDIANLYSVYAKRKNIQTKIQYMIFQNQMLIEIPHDHHVIIYSTMAQYDIRANELTAECDVLNSVLKRTPEEIQHELLQHRFFDINELQNKRLYHTQSTSFTQFDINFYHYIHKIKYPGFKPGQLYPCDFEHSARGVFYVSLFKEDPASEMAQKWLMEHGYFDNDKQQQLVVIFGAEAPMDIENVYNVKENEILVL